MVTLYCYDILFFLYIVFYMKLLNYNSSIVSSFLFMFILIDVYDWFWNCLFLMINYVLSFLLIKSLKIDAYVIINLWINLPFDLHFTIWNIRENKMKYNFKSDWKMNICLSKRNNCIKIEEIKFYYEEFIDKNFLEIHYCIFLNKKHIIHLFKYFYLNRIILFSNNHPLNFWKPAKDTNQTPCTTLILSVPPTIGAIFFLISFIVCINFNLIVLNYNFIHQTPRR